MANQTKYLKPSPLCSYQADSERCTIDLYDMPEVLSYKLGPCPDTFPQYIVQEADKYSMNVLVQHAETLIHANDYYSYAVIDIKYMLCQVPILSTEKREQYERESGFWEDYWY